MRGLGSDDITPLFRSGKLGELPGIGPATLSVLAELVETGESSYLDRLLRSTPEGLLQVARVPGLSPAKAALLHHEIDVESLDDLEEAARDGRLGTVRGFGAKTIKRVLAGIETVRGRAGRLRFPDARTEAEHGAAQLLQHPDVIRVEPAGELRRIADLVHNVVVVAECAGDPASVLRDLTTMAGVLEADHAGDNVVRLHFADDARLDVHCVSPAAFPLALWRATGSAEHVSSVERYAADRGIALLEGRRGTPVTSEPELYQRAGLQFVPPELREGSGETEAAARDELPVLISADDIRGVLHCHTEYSDGSVSISEMAAAARERGWDFIGISDHSIAAFYAGGLKPDDVRRQHDEIDRHNAEHPDFRILKGIECDILATGELDYDATLRASFDYVIGSIHSRFSMDRDTMTARILGAMDDPGLTILAHPTGRLLLQREPYAVDLEAVIEKAAATGVTLELNCDPARLDLDWRWCRRANKAGVMIEIGPDAHSPRGLDHTSFGVKLARKAWLSAADVLNTRPAAEIIAHASRRRAAAR